MKVFIKRDVSAEDSRFELLDETGCVLYRVTGKRTPALETMYICRGEEILAKIRGVDLSFLSTYSVTAGADYMRVVIRPGERMKVTFRCISFFVRGNVLSGSYDIVDADHTVVASVTERFSKGYTELTVFEEKRELFCIAAAVCIECNTLEPTPALQMT